MVLSSSPVRTSVGHLIHANVGRESARLMTAVCWRTKAFLRRYRRPCRAPACVKRRPRAATDARNRETVHRGWRGIRRLAPAQSGCGWRAVSLRRIRPRLGIDQRQLRHPLRRLPHDLERDVAAHGSPASAKRGGASAKILRAIAPILSSRIWLATITGPNPPQRGRDRRIDPRRRHQPPERAKSVSYCPYWSLDRANFMKSADSGKSQIKSPAPPVKYAGNHV